jgi:tRNA 2-thiouridine synthesizing protein A
MSDDITAHQVLDTKGLSCPIPILKTQKAMGGLAAGQILKVETTDPGSQKDMPAWAKRTKAEIVKVEQGGGVFTFYIRKTA